MKIVVGSIIGLIGSSIIILFDIKFVKWLFTLLPQTEWTGFAKVVIIFVDIWLVGGICILPFALGFFIGTFLQSR